MISVLFMALASCYSFAPQPTETPTSTETRLPTSTNTHQPTLAPTGTPVLIPSSTASFGFKRVSINYFLPNLSFEVPISFEIPQDYAWCQTPDDHNTYFWTSQKCGSFSPPKDTSYFQARLNPGGIKYDFQTDKFIGIPNDTNDLKDILSLLDETGAKIHRIERKNIGEFPILILESELSYVDKDEVVKTHWVNRILIATLVDANVVWVEFDFALPTNLEKDFPIWEHFESSFERNL